MTFTFHCLKLLIISICLLSFSAHAQSKNQLNDINTTLHKTKKTLQLNTKKRNKTLAKIESIERQIAERTQRYKLTREKVNNLELEALASRDQQNKLLQQFETEKKQLAKLINSAYLMGRQSSLKVALSQQGTQYLARLNHYAQNISNVQKQQLGTIVTLQNQLGIKQDRLDSKQQQLDKLSVVLEQDQRYLAQSKANRLAMITQLDLAIDHGAQELNQLQQRKKRLEKVLNKIAKRQKARAKQKQRQKNQEKRKSFRKTPILSTAIIQHGSLPMPVKDASITANFGDKRANSGLPWSGILLQGPAGTAIRAISDGEVVYADWLKGYGQIIIIDHGQNLMSLYGHNQAIHKAVGDRIQQSDIIASMGDTAGLKYAALYFEIRKNGQAQNPLKWFHL